MEISNNYKQLTPIYVGDRGWSLSRHPGNHGKFSMQGLTDTQFKSINNWVDKQQKYIQALSLDAKAAIVLWRCYPRVYEEDLDSISLLTEDDEKLRELFELIPSKEIIHRYKHLIQHAILNAPSLTLPSIIFTKLYPGVPIRVNSASKFPSFVQASFIQPSDLNDLISIKLEMNIKCLYMDAGFGNGNEILLPIGTDLHVDTIQTINKKKNLIISTPIFNPTTYDILPDNYIKDDDTTFYENAKKESIEETSIDISTVGKIINTIDYPLYKQKEYNSSSLYESYVLVPTAHGVSASGTLFICSEDKTILLFQRSFLGDFGGTWAGVGGAIGENRVPTYKTKFVFRTYIIDIPLNLKRIWAATNLPRINYEHATYHWFSISEILPQMNDFGNFEDYPESERVTNFLRTYTSQIPLASASLDVRKKILHYGKFAIYLKNPCSQLYELVIPGMSYALWKLKPYLESI
jgi:hypothetical protein